MSPRRLGRELFICLQYLLVSLVATSGAFYAWEKSNLPSAGGEAYASREAVNVKGIVLGLWQGYYRWWLGIFVMLCILRWVVLYIVDRAKAGVKFD